MACGFESEKMTLHVGDGFEFMKNNTQEFDVIITDSSDPIGPAVSLFQENYFVLIKNALRPNGIVCSQGGSFWDSLDLVKNTLNVCKKLFPVAAYATTSVPTYPSGQIGFAMGSLDKDVQFDKPILTFTDVELKSMNVRYYSTEMHKAAFSLPTFVRQELNF